jgi:hypothetical protein
MARFEAILKDGATEVVEGADTYAQEGPMTTFFRTDRGRGVVDAWAVRIASIRTTELLLVRRRSEVEAAAEPDLRLVPA